MTRKRLTMDPSAYRRLADELVDPADRARCLEAADAIERDAARRHSGATVIDLWDWVRRHRITPQ